MWLNEGFATYAEWLWGEDQDLGTTQEVFDSLYNDTPADDPFWDVVIGDPGIPFLFHAAMYDRGAMTLQVLRNEVGDRDFFRILRAWAQRKAGGNGTTAQFVALAERISGEQLDALFDAWLFTAGKPALTTATMARAPAAGAGAPRTPPAAASLLERMANGSVTPAAVTASCDGFLGGEKATLLWDGLPPPPSPPTAATAMRDWIPHPTVLAGGRAAAGLRSQLNPVEGLWSSLKAVELLTSPARPWPS